MSFLDGFKPNLETLKRAAANEDLGMVHCLDSRDGREVAVLCTFHCADNGDVVITPLAIMCEGNPYEYLRPPAPEGGFVDREVAR